MHCFEFCWLIGWFWKESMQRLKPRGGGWLLKYIRWVFVSWSLVTVFVTCGSLGEGFDSLMSSSHACCPLWKTTELLLNYTPEVSIPADTSRQVQREREHVWISEDTFINNIQNSMKAPVSMFLCGKTEIRHNDGMCFLYRLLSFCTSLSSSSFSLVMKLWRTGISNLIYCATWWKGDELHRVVRSWRLVDTKQEKK